MKQFSIVKQSEDIAWLIDLLPMKAKSISLLFSSRINGWWQRDWKEAVVG